MWMTTHRAGLVVIGTLPLLNACSDSPTTASPAAAGRFPTAPQSPATAADNATLGFAAREIPVGLRLMLTGPLVSKSTYFEIPGPLSWSTSDAGVAGLGYSSDDGNVQQVIGLEPGVAVISVAAPGGRASVPFTVLDTTSAPSPVVVDDFYLIEFGEPENVGYAPQFVLHDLTGKGESAVIGVSFDIPDVGSTPRCAMLRKVQPAPTDLFREVYGDFELSIPGVNGNPISAGQSIVAHLTLRVPGPFAKELTLVGRIVPGTLPTTYTGRSRWDADADVLTCG